MPGAGVICASRMRGGLFDQPYLLLSLTSLFWAGNTVLGRFIAGHVPPITLAFIRWGGAFLILLPFAALHLVRDWPIIRNALGLMIVLASTGFSAYNTMAYYGLQYTTAINGLLLQSIGPLFVALWTFALFGDRLTARQAGGICVSLTGVLVIICHGSLSVLTGIGFNRGDLWFLIALAIYGFYTAWLRKRPPMHPLSFLAVGMGLGALVLVPAAALELAGGRTVDARRRHLGELCLCLFFPVAARLSLPQPRHRIDRRQSGGAVHASHAGVWVGAGDRAARRAVRALSRRGLRAGLHGHHGGDAEVIGRCQNSKRLLQASFF